MNISLSGKTALVCGSTQGIGLAIAHELAELGASCILLARNEEELKKSVASIPAVGTQHHTYAVADFSDTNQVLNVAKEIVSCDVVHILINNTGGPKGGPITNATSTDFLSAFTQHLVNNHQLAQVLLPGMRAAGYGRIINIISTSVRIPIPNLGVSNTIRGAVASWAKTLSNEVGVDQITVNNILPGLTDTQRLQSLIDSTAEMRKMSSADVAAEMKASIPMKRFGSAKEIAQVAAFLASPAASYINGVSIPVDGGRTGTI